MTTTLELKLLGEFEFRGAGSQAIPITAKKNKALLAAIALAPSASMPRERIVRLLWSDRGQAQAQGSLRQSLVSLRKDLSTLDASGVLVTDERVTLDRNLVKIDAVEFLRLAASDDGEALRRAAALYRDELLSDADVWDVAFERWLGSERRRFFDTAIGVLEKLCMYEVDGARIEVAKRLVELDPLREGSHRLLMTAYADAGEKGLAMRQYDICRAALKEELDVAPGEETEALRQRLLNEMIKTSPPQKMANLSVAATRTAIYDKPSIAVLPFDKMTPGAEVDDFSDGLTEDIITGLSRVKAISVVARNIMFMYKDQAVDIRALGRELGVRYVLEGSVRRSGTRIRVTAQLIEAASGHHIWAEKFDREGTDTFDLQDQITSSIVASVQTQLILSEGRLAASVDGSGKNVNWLLARSWQQFSGLTAQSLAECQSLAQRALQLEPDNCFGHRMLSVALYHQAYMGFIPWSDQLIDDVHLHAKIAIEAEDADEYSHWAMACAHLLRAEHERAAASLRRALEINPNCSLAHGALGTVLVWAGRSEEAIRSNELAVRINPDDPANFFRYFGLALAHYLAGRYAEAQSYASAVVQTRPVWWLGLLVCTASLAQIGQIEEAAQMLEELRRALPDIRAASLDVLPFASVQDRQHLLHGLMQAGLLDTPAMLVRPMALS